MDTKRIALFTIILLITICSISVVSAGWFDFGGSDSDEIDAKIINASISVTETWVKTSDSVGVYEVFKIVGSSDEDIEEGYKFNESITLDISSANDNVKNKLFEILSGKDSNKTSFTIIADNNVTTDNDYINNMEFFGGARALDNNTITIGDIEYDTVKNASGVSAGNITIKSGKVIIYNLDFPDKNVTINF